MAVNPPTRYAALAGCALIGLLLALFDLLRPVSSADSEPLPEGILANVGDSTIATQRYLELLSDLSVDGQTDLTQADRQFALQRLIDEQLLVNRAIELRLDRTVPGVRKALAAAVLAQVTAEASAASPTDDELRTFFDSERRFFVQPAMYSVSWFLLSGDDLDDRRAAELRKQLMVQQQRDPSGVPDSIAKSDRLPSDLVPASTLTNYLGATLTRHATRLEAGQYTSALFVNGGWHVLYLSASEPRSAGRYEELKPLVAAEFSRREADRALRKYQDWLARRTDITVSAELQ